MTSRFGWVDFDTEQQRQMLDVIQLFRKQDTRDELGIGTIRDAFADYLFPGTSTIQTRARYFFFIPWIYQRIAYRARRNDWESGRISDEAERAEKRLILWLLENGEDFGVIGKSAKKNLQRLPSSIYWAGLGTIGFRLFDGSIAQYHRYLSRIGLRDAERSAGYASEEADESHKEERAWHWSPAIPKRPEGFPNEVSFDLSREEAGLFREKIIQLHGDSLFAYFLRHEKDVGDNAFFWEHPACTKVGGLLKDACRHAEMFSHVIHGAPILYNLMLARKSKDEELVLEYEEMFEDWSNKLGSLRSAKEWAAKPSDFWASAALYKAGIRNDARSFVDKWLGFVCAANDLRELMHDSKALELIRSRELFLKTWKRARLHNNEALLRWSGAAGLGQLDYRWRTTSVILSDIYDGLYGVEAENA